MQSKPFGAWVLGAGLAYVGLAILALTVQSALAGRLDPVFASFTIPFIVLFLLSSGGSWMERR